MTKTRTRKRTRATTTMTTTTTLPMTPKKTNNSDIKKKLQKYLHNRERFKSQFVFLKPYCLFRLKSITMECVTNKQQFLNQHCTLFQPVKTLPLYFNNQSIIGMYEIIKNYLLFVINKSKF